MLLTHFFEKYDKTHSLEQVKNQLKIMNYNIYATISFYLLSLKSLYYIFTSL